ncbi:unnamed protein product [Paramecium octaurelia]|uniref:Uncharacterized protein n=1 Tax=Paramecium octaurelia TaxID=43137 RepID=A0A8S1X1F8_PAROT|nr:unnamed protein product [Paramecium octaurelia]
MILQLNRYEFIKLSNTRDAILSEKRVVIIDDQLNILSSNPFPQTSNSPCQWIISNNQGYIFVGCQKGLETPYLISYKQINDTHFSQFGDIVYFPNVNLQLQKITGRLNTVFAVETNQITLFTLVITVSSWTMKQAQQSVLDNGYFSYSKQMNITDVTFAEYTEDNLSFYKIILTEFNYGIFWLDAFVKNNLVTPYRNGDAKIDPYTYIISKQSTVIHSTTQNISIISVHFYNTQYESTSYKMIVNSVVSTTLEKRYQYVGYQGWSPWGQSISFRNITAIQHRNNLNQTAILIYNIAVGMDRFENSNEDQNPLGVIYNPVDKLTSSPQNHSVLYFNTGNRIVHTIDQNKLQSCDLYNYKLSIE